MADGGDGFVGRCEVVEPRRRGKRRWLNEMKARIVVESLQPGVRVDLFSRRVIGWSMQGRTYAALPLQALLMAVWRRKPKTKVYLHSDQG